MMPRISVIMGVHNGSGYLTETIDSVLIQSVADFELLIVDDGSTDPLVRSILADFQQRDSRIKLIDKKNEGLTVALIDACKAAEGEFIARIDVGDMMDKERLRQQAHVLMDDPECVLVSCHTAFHGPRWDPLWVNRGYCESDRPACVLPETPGEGLKFDISHHGSVMFRKSAYDQAGGYRRAFYYGQDWDLWYRLAERGKFHLVPQVLYHARFFPQSISMRNAQRQRAIAECSKGAFVARQRGLDEQVWLDKAQGIRPALGGNPRRKEGKADREPGLYFIGEALRRSGNPQCRGYLFAAIRARPLSLRAYVRLLQSLALRGNL